MKLRAKQRMLDLTALGVAAVACAGLVMAWRLPTPDVEVEAQRVGASAGQAKSAAPATVALTSNSAHWNRTLRQPLYDPPPPPKQEVVVQVRPITVKLVGTVIEPDNNQAFVRQPSGKVELKRIGDAVTPEQADGVVAEITPTEIVIRRADGEHRVSVEGQN